MDTTWETVKEIAAEAGATYPELVAAQWALESNSGQSVTGNNNFFGIKGKGTVRPTTEYVNGVPTLMDAEFQDFNSPEESIRWIVDRWYKDYNGFEGVNNADSVEEAASDLVSQGYASDPRYATKLLEIINDRETEELPAQVTTPNEPIPFTATVDNAPITPDKFIDFFKFFDKNNLNHVKAVRVLYTHLPPECLTPTSDWIVEYRDTDTHPVPPKVLPVPYFSQRRNYRDQARTCFATSCAMLVEYLRPGTLKKTHPGGQGDDSYLDYLFSIGDTTDSVIEVRTLAHFGVQSRFVANGTFSMLDSQLAKGIPIPIGILHHGTPSRPTGGHWIVVIGKEEDPKAPGGCWYVVNDPYGELNNANGTYLNDDGKAKRYSRNLIKARWTVEGDGSGWAVVAQR